MSEANRGNIFEEMIDIPAQNECVNFTGKNLLIKGAAGSGKSTVILRRAKKLYEERKAGEKIAIVTYTDALVKYTEELLNIGIPQNDIEVKKVDSLGLSAYRKMEGEVHFSNVKDYRALITECVSESKEKTEKKNRFYNIKSYEIMDFIADEFIWIRECRLNHRQEYVDANRRGRGASFRLSDEDKGILWDVFEIFRQKAAQKDEKGNPRYFDWTDLYVELTQPQNLDHLPDSLKYDHILIDEAQDMTVSKLRFLVALAKDTLTIAADFAQKIYKTSFTWKEIGVDIRGNASKSLTRPMRSTKQIVMLAEDVLAKNRQESSVCDEYTQMVYPEKEGNKPILVRCGSQAANDAYLVECLRQFLEKKCVVGVLLRKNTHVDYFGNLLKLNGIPYEVIRKNEEWRMLEPGVKICVAHSSKGLEFDAVVIPEFYNGEFPFRISLGVGKEDAVKQLEVERSLLYVAMTRARENLILLSLFTNESIFAKDFNEDHYILKETK